jgi:hypothetical protein
MCDAKHKIYVITHVEQFSELQEQLRLIISTIDYSYILYRLSDVHTQDSRLNLI